MNLFAAALSTAILSVGKAGESFRRLVDGRVSDEDERCSDSCFSALETFSMYPLTRSYAFLAFSWAR